MLVDNENAKAQKYRNNMKLALNDSRIFLEPHEVNLQALVMLAIHDSRHIPEPEEGLRERLGEWYTRTNKQILEDTLQNERAFSGPNELREMVLGISTIKFEYLHVLMVLLKSHPPSASLRLEAAREAISLLPSMVSNWTSVYNSMIWHLLYFPFTPYFIIFENLVQRNALLRKVMIQQDLELLSTTVSYYSSMTRQMQMLAPLCARLKNIATVFLHLAKLHTDCSDPLYSTQPPAPEPLQSRSSQNQKTSISANSTSTGSLQTELGGECDVDLEQYLQWLPSDVIPLQDTQSTDIPDEDSNQRALGAEVVKPLQAEPRGTKRPFDVMFDWFAWDVYYGEQNIEIG
ncbi:hypothetical protein FocTR4_00004617 [Fusarium oxysporum f. sp. cubense]|uniref:Uncharacterized protein n=1 Tax=Fusarium oxysporum f. sp. cubense TaxID=61366 RepID=A0A5C6TFQ1_FUSOC|nr:hypothetical protein FocTR4_00004617 [Fusarium oxysporum f. sp. cubense]